MSGKSDARWTQAPEQARIAIDGAGFALMDADEAIYRLAWSDVRQIVAYTRFRAGAAELCLAFAFSRRARDHYVVHDRLTGWDCLCAAMTAAFPDADPDWRAKAAHDEAALEAYAPVAAIVPSYTVNPTVVWARQDAAKI